MDSNTIWERICKHKKPVVEPRQSSLFSLAIEVIIIASLIKISTIPADVQDHSMTSCHSFDRTTCLSSMIPQTQVQYSLQFVAARYIFFHGHDCHKFPKTLHRVLTFLKGLINCHYLHRTTLVNWRFSACNILNLSSHWTIFNLSILLFQFLFLWAFGWDMFGISIGLVSLDEQKVLTLRRSLLCMRNQFYYLASASSILRSV